MQLRLALSSLFALTALACGKKAEAPPAEPAQGTSAVLADTGVPTEPAPAASPDAGDPGAAQAAAESDEPTRGIALALSLREKKGKPRARAEVLFLRPRSRKWETVAFDDPKSSAFTKVIPLLSSVEPTQLLTLSGDAAAVKGWRRAATGFEANVHWAEKIGTKTSRIRDGELGDVDSNNAVDIVVGGEDQGVLAYLKRNPEQITTWQVEKIDRLPNTRIEEVELGDMDRDGTTEIYVVPRVAKPGKGGEGPGRVLRYVPLKQEKATVVADLGERQVREILVDDVDGDGRDELYVSVEALTKGKGDDAELIDIAKVVRFSAETPASEGVVIAHLHDLSCRALTAGDVDGDGHKELFASCARTGVWMMRHAGMLDQAWSVQQLDKEPTGELQAALAADLDEDGRAELYVAADDQGDVRRYVWESANKFAREVIFKRTEGTKATTYAITLVGR